MIQLGAMVLWLGLAVSPVLVPVLLLNRRGRKESALLGAVWDQLSAPALRGRIAVRVRCALLGRAGVVALDMRDCTRDEVWEVVKRLSRNLPAHARLVVDGLVDRQVPATFALEAAQRPSRAHPLSAAVAAGELTTTLITYFTYSTGAGRPASRLSQPPRPSPDPRDT